MNGIFNAGPMIEPLLETYLTITIDQHNFPNARHYGYAHTGHMQQVSK